MGQIRLQQDANGTKNFSGCFPTRVKRTISKHAIRFSIHRRYTRHHKRCLETPLAGSRKSFEKTKGSRDAIEH